MLISVLTYVWDRHFPVFPDVQRSAVKVQCSTLRELQASPAVPASDCCVRPPLFGDAVAFVAVGQAPQSHTGVLIAVRTPRSACGNTSRRPSEKIKNICAVQTPIPFTFVSSSITFSSGHPAHSIQRQFTAVRRGPRDPADMSLSDSNTPRYAVPPSSRSRDAWESSPSGSRYASNFVRIDLAALPEICCDRIENTSIWKRFFPNSRANGPACRITSRITGSDSRMWRRPRFTSVGSRGIRFPSIIQLA